MTNEELSKLFTEINNLTDIKEFCDAVMELHITNYSMQLSEDKMSLTHTSLKDVLSLVPEGEALRVRLTSPEARTYAAIRARETAGKP